MTNEKETTTKNEKKIMRITIQYFGNNTEISAIQQMIMEQTKQYITNSPFLRGNSLLVYDLMTKENASKLDSYALELLLKQN